MTRIWDPIGQEIAPNTFDVEQQVLLNEVAKYKNNPNLIRKNLIIWGSLPLFTAIFLYLVGILFTEPGFWLIFISVVPVFSFYAGIYRLQKKLILYLLCQKNQWVFSANPSPSRIQALMASYPQTFQVGRRQEISYQIWGSVKGHDREVEFWRGTFSYTVGSGRSSRSYTRPVFILKLPFYLEDSFSLTRSGFFSGFLEDLKTESEEFNKIFDVRIAHGDKTSRQRIIAILSPSVQVRLIDFSKKYSFTRIDFTGNVMIIVFSREIWKPQYTNFIKKVEVDPRDQDFFYSCLTDMIQIPIDMLKFI